MARTKEQIQNIDETIALYYLDKGGRYCADQLNEPIAYISSRVQYLRRAASDKKTTPLEKNEMLILKGKLKAKNDEIDELYHLLKEQKKHNKELRTENIRLIVEKRKVVW